MKVLIKNKEYTLKEIGRFGREGEIYSIEGYPEQKLAKVYDDDRRTAYIQRKVTAFTNRFRNFNLGGVENFIAFPELPVYEVDNHSFCGFLMKNFNNHTDLFDNRYDLKTSSFKNKKIDDSGAISIIATLFAYLELLHKAGFILGDVNPDNLLLDKKTFMPAIVDFDSAQLGTFYSNTNRQSYIDPTVRADGYGRKRHFIYTTDSDIYAMAIVCYEFMVGIHPYFFQTTTPTDTEYKKKNLLSFIDYFEGNGAKTRQFDFKVFENPAFEATNVRLNQIKTGHNGIYLFFKSVFSEGLRNYFDTHGSKKYSIKADKSLQDDSDVSELIPQSKEDPEELELFMKQYNLKLF